MWEMNGMTLMCMPACTIHCTLCFAERNAYSEYANTLSLSTHYHYTYKCMQPRLTHNFHLMGLFSQAPKQTLCHVIMLSEMHHGIN